MPGENDERTRLLDGTDREQRYDAQPHTIKAANTDQEISRKDLRWIFAGTWSMVFLGALDGTVVATLLTPIGSYFKKSNQASYLGTSYLLSVCCFTPLYGRLSDILGRKGALLLAVSTFSLGTVLCGVATSMEMLIAARTIAGIGGGGVMTVSNIITTDLIPLKQRGLYQGYVNIMFGLGAGLGGPLGGFLNDALGWRSAFLLQIPLLVVSATIIILKVDVKLSSTVVNEPMKLKLKRIDWLGSATLVGAVATLLLAFSLKTSEELAWTSPLVLGLFGASAVLWPAFVCVEAFWSSHPVMPMRLIKQRTPAAVSCVNFFGSITAFSMLYNLPLYFEAVRLESATTSGLHLLPNSAAVGVGSILAGFLMRRTGKYYWLTLGSAALGLSANIAVALWGKHTAPLHFWIDVVGQGVGYSGVLTTTLIAMIATVSKDDMAVATGITYLFRYTGQVLGVSLTGAALQSILTSQLRARITGPGAAALIERIRHDTEIIRTLEPVTRQAAVDSYAQGLRVVFIAQAVSSFLSLLFCSLIEEHPLPGNKAEQEAHERRISGRDARED